eukprot:520649_1
MKRKLKENSEVANKKQKTDPAYCKFGCGRICNPEKTNKGNNYDTCCKPCAKNTNDKNKVVYHDWDCNQRIYKYKIEIGEIEAVDDWNGINKRIAKKVNKEFGTAIESSLSQQFMNMDINKIKNILLQYITPQIIPRPFWTPETEEKENISVLSSKYGGKPLLFANEEWPKCGRCNNFMPLFVQLNVNNLPNEYKQKYVPKNKNGNILWKDHLIQLFYCCNIDNCDDGYEAFNNQHKQRLIPIPNDNNIDKYKDDEYLNEIMKIIKEKCDNGDIDWENNEVEITEWNKQENVEGAVYQIEDELQKTFSNKDMCLDDENFGIGVLMFVEDNFLNEEDKLWGFPAFINDYEYPDCCQAECDGKLRGMIFQTDAQILDFCWSDVGVGQILYCEHHPFTLGFTWQSS